MGKTVDLRKRLPAASIVGTIGLEKRPGTIGGIFGPRVEPIISACDFWYRTFGGRNIEVKSTGDIRRALRTRIDRNNSRYGPEWRFDKIFIVGHGGPGALIFKRGQSLSRWKGGEGGLK